MKKKYVAFLLAAVTGLTLSAYQCAGAAETELIDEPGTETSMDEVVPSDYLIADAADYVTLGDYEAIPVEVATYEFTDEVLEDRIQEELEMYAEEVEVDRPAEMDDIIYADLSYTVEDSDEPPYTEEDFFTTIGYEEFGPEFDEHLIGVSAGETAEFSIDFPEDDIMTEWAGKTVDFTVEVTSVCSLNVPEYDETFITEVAGFDSQEEYEQYLLENMEQEYEDSSYSDAIENLMQAAIDRTEFSGYPQELYDACWDDAAGFYMSFLGTDKIEDVYDTFGLTEEDLDEETMYTVNRRLLISAYFLSNGDEATAEDYISYLEENAPLYGEDDIETFEEDYSREELMWMMYESRFTSELYEMADITEVVQDLDDLFDDFEDDLEEETDSEFSE